MKKLLPISISLSAALFLFAGCVNTIDSKPHVIEDTPVAVVGDYLASDYKGNFVWGGAMNLAWTELGENIVHENVELATEDAVALDMVENLNNPVFTKNDLDEDSYYIKSGYGQATVDAINKESKEKFPTKSFADLSVQLDPTDIISYAYFLKQVEYDIPFEKNKMLFEGVEVKSFNAASSDQRENVKIISYESDDKFIVRLQLKDKTDQLILAKGYDMTDPQAVVDKINQKNSDQLPTLESVDRFEAPALHLDHHRDYVELNGKVLANKGFEDYAISQMFENIKFDMDETGARAENEAAMIFTKSAGPGTEGEPRNFILDTPYWVIMQRAGSKNPYFILGVNNTELMTTK